MRDNSDRMLLELKRRGPQATATLAAACAITPMGAHKLLQALASQGLVQAQDEVHGVGRPRRVWGLRAAGHARFPDRHAELNLQLLAQLGSSFGPQALDQLIAAREAQTLSRYQAQLQPLRSLAGRLRRLAQLRATEGYMARVERAGRDWLLIEDHCPICAAARACQGFCRSELALFQACLAPWARVTREEHLLAGARRCAYRVCAVAPRLTDVN
jgi:predicted ArsR family transcriptional regulator